MFDADSACMMVIRFSSNIIKHIDCWEALWGPPQDKCHQLIEGWFTTDKIISRICIYFFSHFSRKEIRGDISHFNWSSLCIIPVQMWSRPCPILFATSTCWSRGPNSWRLWLWTMWRRTRRRRSGHFLQFWGHDGLSSVCDSCARVRVCLCTSRMRQKPAQSEKASRSRPPWRTGLAPPLALQATPLWPPPPKRLQPVSKPHPQVASTMG